MEADTEPPNCKKLSKKKCKDSRRFTDEQVRLLESMFKVETKIEPRKKLQLARDLGLQPRQVAIWFQNRRARWKSKQIEHEYRVLKAEFDNLNMQFESLKTEKESLLMQLQALNDQLGNSRGGCSRSQDSIDNKIYTSSNNGGSNIELKDSPGCSNATSDQETVKEMDNDRTGVTRNLRWKREPEFWNLEELGDSSLASPQRLCSVGLNGTFDNFKWWEF